MKNVLLVALLLITSFTFSQAIEYVYDDAGNRIQRKEFILGGGGNPTNRMAPTPENLTEELIEDFKLAVYPNPVKDIVNLKGTGKFEPYQLSIADLSGKMQLNTTIQKANEQINLSHLPKGVYIIRTTIQKKYKEWKMIKQ
jgi:Secretion system C-terminal sorting domain